MAACGAIVEVTLTDGRKLDHFTKYPPGTKDNPLSTEAVSAKARDPMVPVLGADKTDGRIDQVNMLERLSDITGLRQTFTI